MLTLLLPTLLSDFCSFYFTHPCAMKYVCVCVHLCVYARVCGFVFLYTSLWIALNVCARMCVFAFHLRKVRQRVCSWGANLI